MALKIRLHESSGTAPTASSAYADEYNERLKACKTSDDVIALYMEFWDNPDSYYHYLRTRKTGREINNFFRTSKPDVIEYICDGDSFVRKCQVKNLHRFISFK